MSYKLDLHTHSVASPDGALTSSNYQQMLDSGKLDYIAITDHNTVDYALRVQAELGERIIVGEEIKTTEGEIVGLYLKQTIPKGLSPTETVAAIREQGGLVCIPHPFETVRSGMTQRSLEVIAKDVDIIEVHNGRAIFQNRSKLAYAWAATHDCAGAANSDSHGVSGWGRTYTTVAALPTRQTLLELLKDCQYATGFPGIHAMLYPKLNRGLHSIRNNHA
jgi:predicted metal-dependent phosphoesterase TrpH